MRDLLTKYAHGPRKHVHEWFALTVPNDASAPPLFFLAQFANLSYTVLQDAYANFVTGLGAESMLAGLSSLGWTTNFSKVANVLYSLTLQPQPLVQVYMNHMFCSQCKCLILHNDPPCVTASSSCYILHWRKYSIFLAVSDLIAVAAPWLNISLNLTMEHCIIHGLWRPYRPG